MNLKISGFLYLINSYYHSEKEKNPRRAAVHIPDPGVDIMEWLWLRSKIGNAKSKCFSMVTGFILKPRQLSVHGLWIDISIQNAMQMNVSVQKIQGLSLCHVCVSLLEIHHNLSFTLY